MPHVSHSLNIESMVPGIAWPAIPNGRASQLLAVQFQLELSQWHSAEELLEQQIRQLGILYAHAYQHVPFYRERMERHGLEPSHMRGTAEWLQLPLLTRRDIQQAGEALHCRGPIPAHGPLSQTVTSGSTGQPIVALGTTVTRLFYAALTFRQHLWFRRDFSLKLASIRSIAHDSSSDQHVLHSDVWGVGTLDIVPTGPAAALSVHTSIEEQAAWLIQENPGYLNTYPSLVLELARHFRHTGQQLHNLREVRTFGEVLDPQVRKACRDVWGVPAVDTYSTQELGYIAFQCPEYEHYHVQSESVLVEVLDDNGQPCSPGQVGRVVITALHNFAMPFLRYEIGDYAEVGEPCPCGRGLLVLKRIMGRQRHVALLPDGTRVWPYIDVEDAASSLPPILQFQVIQRSLTDVDVLLVTPRALTVEEETLVRQWTHNAMCYPFNVRIQYVDSIPRGKTGKFEDFRCDVAGETGSDTLT